MMKIILRAVFLVVLAGLLGCGTTNGEHWYHDFYDKHCEEMADNYRLGLTDHVCFEEMIHYFNVRMGKMTVVDLNRLLGEPRTVMPDDSYYAYALAPLYGYDIVWDPEWCENDKEDIVLHYGQNGPPHNIPDESFNLFFVAKNGIVVSVRGLFP